MRSFLVCGALAIVAATNISAQSPFTRPLPDSGSNHWAYYVGGTALTSAVFFSSVVRSGHRGGLSPHGQFLNPGAPYQHTGWGKGDEKPNDPPSSPPDNSTGSPPADDPIFTTDDSHPPRMEPENPDGSPVTTPEPGMLSLMATGVAGLGLFRRR